VFKTAYTANDQHRSVGRSRSLPDKFYIIILWDYNTFKRTTGFCCYC